MAKASRSDIIKFRISYDAEKLSKKLPDMISDGNWAELENIPA